MMTESAKIFMGSYEPGNVTNLNNYGQVMPQRVVQDFNFSKNKYVSISGCGWG